LFWRIVPELKTSVLQVFMEYLDDFNLIETVGIFGFVQGSGILSRMRNQLGKFVLKASTEIS